MIFSKRLKELRTEKRLTQDQLSEKTGLSHGCIAMLEVEKRAPTAQTLNILADFFQCTTDYLLGREDDLGNVSVHYADTAPLPKIEQALLDNFRKLPSDLQHRASVYMKKLVEVIDDERYTAFPVKKSPQQTITLRGQLNNE